MMFSLGMPLILLLGGLAILGLGISFFINSALLAWFGGIMLILACIVWWLSEMKY